MAPAPLPRWPNPPASLGLYLAVPFCRSKCSYCNFASQVFAPAAYGEYAELLAREIALAAAADGVEGARLDTIYWGGGTPTLLSADCLARIGGAIREHFELAPELEHTVEAAPGTLTPAVLEALAGLGVNRLSLGVQSFHDAEARAVGRLHQRATVLADIERARASGISNLNLDLIAGLPHQTLASWRESLAVAAATGVPHLSVYMLEVDEDSRLGHELLAGGARYHAHAVPDDDLIADAYELACEQLEAAGWRQYEISNFAQPGRESRHNERYWRRQPYLGVGLEAHSFLPHSGRPVRFANPGALGDYLAPLRENRLPRRPAEALTPAAAMEEYYFLGLRRTAGVALQPPVPAELAGRLERLEQEGLLARSNGCITLTARGRLLSNRVFAEFLGVFAEARDTLEACEAVSAPKE